MVASMRLIVIKIVPLPIFTLLVCLAGVVPIASAQAIQAKSASDAASHATTQVTPEVLLLIIKSGRNTEQDDDQPLDADVDGISDMSDQCPNTPAEAVVNVDGCAESQLDNDNDTVYNDVDQCPATPSDEPPDASGCSPSQLDSDNDGVSDDIDQCSNSSPGVAVDESGCEDTSLSLNDDYIQNVNPLIVDFQRGCTSSGCHGNGSAPGGLSLYGSSVAGSNQLNYDSLTSYIDRSSVSRLLGKLSGTLGHGGGVRYGTGTAGYQVIKTWAEAVEAR